MFNHNINFNQDISSWDVSSSTTFKSMFEGTNSLSAENRCLIHTSFSTQNENWLVIYNNGYSHSCWDEYCSSEFTIITQDNIYDAVDLWFSDQSDAESIYGHISNWNVSCVHDMSNLFKDRDEFNDDISQWDVSNVDEMDYMFRNTDFNGDLSSWDVSNVTNMMYMFDNNKTFNGDISSWDVGNVENMQNMFWRAESFSERHIFMEC